MQEPIELSFRFFQRPRAVREVPTDLEITIEGKERIQVRRLEVP